MENKFLKDALFFCLSNGIDPQYVMDMPLPVFREFTAYFANQKKQEWLMLASAARAAMATDKAWKGIVKKFNG